MAEYYENYTEGPKNDGEYKDSGTAPMILGLCSIIFSLTFSRIIGIILGIIAICLGSKRRAESSQANAGFIMGIIGLSMALVIYAFVIMFLFVPLFSGFVFFF